VKRVRLRELGITIGAYPTGSDNAITDVPGVLVGHTTLIHDEPRIARTGVTTILPRPLAQHDDYVFAGYHSLNGCGEMTGMHWVAESGTLTSPIALTNTHQVGTVHEALIRYAIPRYPSGAFHLPVVAETWDGWLNDADAFHITREHLFAALDSAVSGPVAEGNVGGGTGMICHDFKGGIGTASRLVDVQEIGRYTVGALVQANYGHYSRGLLRVNGAPVGQAITPALVPTPFEKAAGASSASSIIVVIATDAPLLPGQCRRLAQRATIGAARVGCVGHNGSGDLFLAFATGNHIPAAGRDLLQITALRNQQMNGLFEATAEAVEEAILNALTTAETMTGWQGRTAHALPLDLLQRVMRPANRQ
jgi:D-aminopeptidase